MSAISGMRIRSRISLHGLDVLLLGHGDADDLAAGLFQAVDLLERRLDVEGVGRRHRLDPDRLIAADDMIADTHFARLVPLDRRRVRHRSSSWRFDESTGCARSTCADHMTLS